ncbi:hypothetical protein HYZ98_01195 [Candidatus Peregrinibacteria bacterium]|nr:hypothetical protein [Candidatus Peregrinibacteria bacterium]
MIAKTRLRGFTDKIWSWYTHHKRMLPWRDLWHESEGMRAYKVLVSEVMLQQTQVPRVMVLFPQFLEKFPTMGDLAKASNKEVVFAWRGLGYNRRALMLRDAARTIDSIRFPKTVDKLLKIPGIGPYTAAAIRNFAFNIPTPCLDTNIRRVLHRAFIGPERSDGTWKKSDCALLSLAREVLQIAVSEYPRSVVQYPAADWHHALMDYGSLKEKAVKISRNTRTEPGRTVGSRYIPNRIFRGKIIEVLRDQTRGVSLSEMGKYICSDWDRRVHQEWLTTILEKLKKDALISEQKGTYILKD